MSYIGGQSPIKSDFIWMKENKHPFLYLVFITEVNKGFPFTSFFFLNRYSWEYCAQWWDKQRCVGCLPSKKVLTKTTVIWYILNIFPIEILLVLSKGVFFKKGRFGYKELVQHLYLRMVKGEEDRRLKKEILS